MQYLINFSFFSAVFGGHDDTQLLFMGQGIVENQYNVFKILELLGFPMEIDGIVELVDESQKYMFIGSD